MNRANELTAAGASHGGDPQAGIDSAVSPVLATAAIGMPMLLAFNLPPSSTFLNQAAALVGWGAWLVLLNGSLPRGRHGISRGLISLQSGLLLTAAAAFVSPLWAGLPWSLALSAIGMIAAACLAALTAAALTTQGHARQAFKAFCIGMVVTGGLSSIVGLIQVFAPSAADGMLVARTYIDGRAVGNMRQPNHLSSLLLWSIVAAVWLGQAQVLKRWASTLLVLLFIFVDVLTGSRTGALSMGVLLVWALLDRRLYREFRWLLGLACVIYAVFWYGTGLWADATHHVFGGETRFSTKGDISSSRGAIWSNTLALIRMHPWLGVGFGEFNFAWTLTPFPDRPVAFFDHTHNLVLQVLVELGIPLGGLVLVLLGHALWRAWRSTMQPVPDGALPGEAQWRRAAFMMLLLILLHSMLEYPLWYAYYLLPAAFVFGLCLAEPARLAGAARPGVRSLVVASLILTMAGAASLLDYSRVVVIFAPSPDDTHSLAERIVDGRKSVFFSHHADYAAATSAGRPGDVMPAFLGAPHYLLDARLMQAWAKALDQSGDTEHARYVAQRLKEFRNDQSKEFFALCGEPKVPATALPFQCSPPSRTFTYEDFR